MDQTNGKVFLTGFELEPAEKAITDNILKNYSHKIGERAEYEYLRLRLKKSQHGKAYHHDVDGKFKVGNNVFSAKVTDYNLFSAVAEVLEKLLNEMTHKIRTNRQTK